MEINNVESANSFPGQTLQTNIVSRSTVPHQGLSSPAPETEHQVMRIIFGLVAKEAFWLEGVGLVVVVRVPRHLPMT